MARVDRDAYMERLWALEGTRDIRVITGMRKLGKSEPMKAFSASAARKDPSANYVYIDLLDLDIEPLLEYHALHRENARVDSVAVAAGGYRAKGRLSLETGVLALSSLQRRPAAPFGTKTKTQCPESEKSF